MKQTLIKTSLQTLLLLLSMCLILFLMRTEKMDIPIKAESHKIQSFVNNVYAGNPDAFRVKFTPDGTRL